MSATSEELAAQAEQLQSNIAYFRLEDSVQIPQRATFQRAAGAPRRSVRQTAVARPTKNAAGAPTPARSGNGKADGVALELTPGGADRRDAEVGEMRQTEPR